jgi:hypothetical protein
MVFALKCFEQATGSTVTSSLPSYSVAARRLKSGIPEFIRRHAQRSKLSDDRVTAYRGVV